MTVTGMDGLLLNGDDERQSTGGYEWADDDGDCAYYWILLTVTL